MNRKRIFALAFAVLMVLALAACGMKNNDKMGDMSGNGSAMTGEPKNAEEALALHKELLEQENAILSENTELWEKVFTEADKGMAMIEDGKNYGDFLLDTVEAAKEQFTDKEYEWLKESATEISNIENRLTELEEKYPEIMQKSMDGDMSMPAGSDTSTPPDDGTEKCPLGSDFIFVNGTESFVPLNIELADANGKVVSRTRGLEVPYRRGHLTTLRGNFLTNEMQGGINIDTGYDDEIDIDLDSF